MRRLRIRAKGLNIATLERSARRGCRQVLLLRSPCEKENGTRVCKGVFDKDDIFFSLSVGLASAQDFSCH